MTLAAAPADLHSRRAAAVALVVVSAVWGSTFGLSKDLLERLPVVDYLGLRYLVAALALLVLRPRLLGILAPRHWRLGAGLGLVYGVAQLLQFHGLQHTPPTVSAFLVAMYVVLTPMLGAVLLQHRPDRVTVAATLLAASGVALMSLRGWSVGPGEGMTLVAAALYAIHLLALGRWARRGEAVALTFVQLLTMGAVLGAVGATSGGLALPRAGDLAAFLYLAVIAAAAALLVQTWAQGHLAAGQTAVLLVLEPVWAAAFGAAVWGEQIAVRTLGGAGLVLAAMLLVLGRPTADPMPEPTTPHP